MTTAIDRNVDDEQPLPLPAIQPLAKKQANAALHRRLLEEGVDEAAAEAITRAVVDPTDARNRLDRLLPVRVPGGRLYSLDVMVWAPAITNYPVNNREATARSFPASGAAGKSEESLFRPLRPPTDASDGSARLEQHADSVEQLLWSLERSVSYLLDNNNWVESIGEQGVMLPITTVPMTIKYGNETPDMTILATGDGSSRMASVHEILGLKPRDIVVDLPTDERAFRGTIADTLASLNRSMAEISANELRKIRAVQVPARILLRWESDGGPMGFAKAVEALVHLLHVEPARPWDDAGSLDAQADAVLASLWEAGVLTHTKRDYADGMLAPEDAREVGLGGYADERALWLLDLMSSNRTNVKKAIRSGILELTRGKQVRKEAKVKIAVELALRAVRVVEKPQRLKIARVALQYAYGADAVWGKDLLKVALDDSADGLRDAALKELEENGEPGPAGARLAAQGGFWLAVNGVLRDAHFFASVNERDGRSPQKILEGLMRSEHGIRVLHRALTDGRDRMPLTSIEVDGQRRISPTGQPIGMDNEWLRTTVVPRGGAAKAPQAPEPEFPTRQLSNRVRNLRDRVDAVADALRELRDVKNGDGALIDTYGIKPEDVKQILDTFNLVQRKLIVYEDIWERTNSVQDEPQYDDLEDDPDEDELDAELQD